jgi:hypothetical protein
MRILLAGMENTDNQFGRSIARLGCEVIHTSGDPGPFPTNCDAAVIAKCQISHKKFEQVKDTYKAMKKPFFIASIGFTQIRDEFEAYVAKNKPAPVVVAKAPEVVRRNTFVNTPTLVRVQAPPPKPAEAQRKRLTSEVTDKIRQIISDCHLRGEGNPVMVAEIAKAGLKKASGEPVDAGYVSQYKFWMIKEGIIPKRDEVKSEALSTSPAKVDELVDKRVPEEEVDDAAAGRQLALLGKVFASNLAPDRILRLAKRIQAGEILAEESITATQAKTVNGTILQITRTSIFSDKDVPLLTLSRVQALALAQVQHQIEDFATGED